MTFTNAYEDPRRAAAYDELDCGGTYHLAFRDLPELVSSYVEGARAVDFGCGTGRSTRALRALGLTVVGLDVSREMVARARRRDPGGDYRVIADGDFSALSPGTFDLVQSAFTFDNVPRREQKVRLLRGLGALLRPEGVLLNIVSTPEIYRHEWVSFTTRDFPENLAAVSGGVVRTVTRGHEERGAVEDVLFSDADWRDVFEEAALSVVRVERPLARGDEGVDWVSETTIAPWAIYVARPLARI